ncbi:glycosyltransferase family A protein [Paucibacter sp. APW11]|uniref:Glycosyltransferase family A protein n=1 Tax=Roseateles aquae TaxID=3077235 RepID=A0ABU3PFM6_9BURK|nr:glycosyltransferase family A protein [Paucibacter sp. APW11]MDT9001331.1 glycosyltransferase family A protein [Paucibacter sp. APW11]
MKASLVLATVGRTDDLARGLDALCRQTDQRFEVLLVDQNPDDRLNVLVDEAKAGGLNIRHLRLGRPSLSGARNLGIAQATGEVIAFPDDDCWYEPDTVARVLAAFEADSALDGLSINWVEQSQVLGQRADGHALELAAWRAYRGGEASSISLFLKAALLRRLHGFDERLGVGQWFGAAEEIDLVLRALHAGARIEGLSTARVHHAFGRRPAVALSQAWRSAMSRARGTGAIYAKHRLSVWIVLRGLLAPTVKALLRPGLQSMAVGLATSWGRLQGLRQWREGAPGSHQTLA